jgi:hypothetical protein
MAASSRRDDRLASGDPSDVTRTACAAKPSSGTRTPKNATNTFVCCHSMVLSDTATTAAVTARAPRRSRPRLHPDNPGTRPSGKSSTAQT